MPSIKAQKIVYDENDIIKSTSGKAQLAAEEILNTRGNAPRSYRNMLAFVAPDARNLESLGAEVRRFIAWTSIVSDKEDLNLDGGQIREAQSSLSRSNETVELRLKETWSWLMISSIDLEGTEGALRGTSDSLPAGRIASLPRPAAGCCRMSQSSRTGHRRCC